MNNYFPHDSNARNSDKLIPLRARFGAEGYGIYFMIIERLREESSYMSVKDYNMLAFDFRVDAGKVKSVIEDFGLFAFTEDGKCFYSESLVRRMKAKDDKSKKAKLNVASKWNNINSQNAAKRSERLSAARKIAAHTKEEWEEMKEIIGHCVICGKSADETMLVKDHIKPIYQGGSDGISNLQPLCRSCNSRKGADTNDYRIAFCKEHGIEMPTKWLQNAYETPTIKLKESKVKNISTSDEVESGPTPPLPPGSCAPEASKPEIFKKIKEEWNATCTSFPRLQHLSESRKNKIRIRIAEMGGAEKALPLLKRLFEKMQQTKFLRGENPRGWRASFDWVFANDKNWLKIFEGIYDEQKSIQNDEIRSASRGSIDSRIEEQHRAAEIYAENIRETLASKDSTDDELLF